jgi:hypothetical protein
MDSHGQKIEVPRGPNPWKEGLEIDPCGIISMIAFFRQFRKCAPEELFF